MSWWAKSKSSQTNFSPGLCIYAVHTLSVMNEVLQWFVHICCTYSLSHEWGATMVCAYMLYILSQSWMRCYNLSWPNITSPKACDSTLCTLPCLLTMTGICCSVSSEETWHFTPRGTRVCWQTHMRWKLPSEHSCTFWGSWTLMTTVCLSHV